MVLEKGSFQTNNVSVWYEIAFSLFSNKREISVKELKITYFWNILLKWDSTLNLEIKLEY